MNDLPASRQRASSIETLQRIYKLGLQSKTNIAFIALGKCELDCYLSYNMEAHKRLKDGRLRTRNLKGYTIVEIV